MVQLQLANSTDKIRNTPRRSIAERFADFHIQNPDVYQAIVEIASVMKGRGIHKMGIALIFERLRWLHYIDTKGAEPFKLSNSFRSEYSRLIMQQEPSLAGFFEIRELRRKQHDGPTHEAMRQASTGSFNYLADSE